MFFKQIDQVSTEPIDTPKNDERENERLFEELMHPNQAGNMIVSYNFQFIDAQQVKIPVDDRAFCYGDGLFESLIYKNGKILFFKDHIKRLKKGMHAFEFEGVGGIKKSIVKHQLEKLLTKNNITGDGRLKIQVWRKQGGLYHPENLHFNILMSARSMHVSSSPSSPLKASFSEKIKLHRSEYSAFKTANSLPYVLASIEKGKKGVDDLVLLNNKNHITECIASNIFWVKGNKIFTPSLKTGCVEGVARKNIIKLLEKKGYKVFRVKAAKADLLKADHVFTSNVSGIRQIHEIDGQNFDHFKVIDKLVGSF